jgi:hypothetical protein
MKTKYLIGMILLVVMISSAVILVYYHSNIENYRHPSTENNNSREAPVIVPGRSHFNESRFMWPDMVELSAGETKEVNITLETRKDGPGRVTYSFFRVKRVYSDEEIPMPDGLNVSIEPSTFMMYPNETYNTTVTINTSQDIPRGEYTLSVHIFFESGIRGEGWLTVNVV